jgi:hypothetical protein
MSEEKTPEQMAQEERTRNSMLGANLLKNNVKDYLIYYIGHDEAFGLDASSDSFGIGAAKRIELFFQQKIQKQDQKLLETPDE